MVGETIFQVFGGEISAFMEQAVSGTIFGGIRRLLDGQIERLSALERDVLERLAVEREAVTFLALATDLGRASGDRRCSKRSKRCGGGRWWSGVSRAGFTLSSVVLEYVTDQLVARAVDEIERSQLELPAPALVQAQAKAYVRRSQERLIAEPLLERLVARSGGRRAAEQQLLAPLVQLRGRAHEDQGYGPGNLVNLLRLVRGDLRGVDLSGLSLRLAFLQEVDAQDASLAVPSV